LGKLGYNGSIAGEEYAQFKILEKLGKIKKTADYSGLMVKKEAKIKNRLYPNGILLF